MWDEFCGMFLMTFGLRSLVGFEGFGIEDLDPWADGTL